MNKREEIQGGPVPIERGLEVKINRLKSELEEEASKMQKINENIQSEISEAINEIYEELAKSKENRDYDLIGELWRYIELLRGSIANLEGIFTKSVATKAELDRQLEILKELIKK
jgi:broad-specificity NMP kinase